MNFKWLLPPRPLMILAFGVFGVSIFFPFIALDDAKHIWQNPYVMSLSPENLQFFWKAPYYGLFVPLIYNFWAVLAWISQTLGLKNEFTVMGAGVFHFANVALHLLNIQLAWWLAIQIFSRLYPGEAENNNKRAFLSLVPFAIHPLQAESVAWASGLKDVLSATPSFMALLFGLASLPIASPAKKKKDAEIPQLPKFFHRRSELGFFLSVAAALLVKPSAVVLPVAFLVMIWALDRNHWQRAVKLAGPALVVALYVAYLTKASQPDARLEFELEVWQRPLVALGSLGFYIFKFMAPWPLSPDYGLTPPRLLALPQAYPYMGIAVTFLTIGLVAFSRQWRPTALAIGWFALGLLPVLGLIPFEFQNLSTVADRYNYFYPSLAMEYS